MVVKKLTKRSSDEFKSKLTQSFSMRYLISQSPSKSSTIRIYSGNFLLIELRLSMSCGMINEKNNTTIARVISKDKKTDTSLFVPNFHLNFFRAFNSKKVTLGPIRNAKINP